QPVNGCQITSGGVFPASDIVKFPEITNQMGLFMTKFTVRVELHAATADDYEELHNKMKRKGFKRTLSNGEGISYQLPDAEYSYSGDITRKEVLRKAYDAAETVKEDPAILVTESAGRSWRGLRACKRNCVNAFSQK
ncbi:type V toxin-antitoxin system endoribonuclease antitoxin GhoS, partial [Salmonella enterica]|nr:type V toxin-antitoxin system endoribonuclease antitoxin GhoS [Salmonella enterica]